MGFNAEERVSDLEYDLTRFCKGAKGCVPEPSQEAVDTYRKFVVSIRGKDETAKVRTDSVKALAELCQGQPSAEQLASLPYRALTAFSGWLYGQLVNPT